MRDELSGLTALLTVASKRSFTAAATELGVSPSAVSQTIAGLEERFGVRLVQRTTRSVGLTEAGTRFLARLSPAIAEVREAIESLGELRDHPAGTLRIALSRRAYLSVIAPMLPAFMARYPEIAFDFDVDDAFVDIVADGFDAGIRIGEMVEPEMVGVKIGPPLSMVVVGSPAYFARHPPPKHPRDLHAHDCIGYRRRTRGGVYRWEFTERKTDFDVAVTGRVMLNDGELMLDAALAGVGLAYLIESTTLDEHLTSKRLVRVLAPYCTAFPGFYLYYPSRAHVAPKLQALVAALRWKR